jgi:hypothetical protein
MVVGWATVDRSLFFLAICDLETTIRTSSASKLWTSVHKLAEYNGVNKEVSRGHDSRRVVAAAFLAMQTEVSACLRRQ